MPGLPMAKSKLLSTVHYGGKKYPYGMLRQSFPELAYNEKASLFLIEGHFSTAAAVPFLALPAQGGPALAVGPSSSPSSITSCVAKVCYEAQLCTGPQKL